MVADAVIYLAAVAAFLVGLGASPDHTFSGPLALLTFLTLLTSGVVLAASVI